MATDELVTDPGEGVEAWERFLTQVTAANDPATTPYLLGAATLTNSLYLAPNINRSTPGLPMGRPNTATLRKIGTQLVEWGRGRPDDVGLTWQILGLVAILRYPKALGEPDDELHQHLQHVEAAVQLAADLDPDLHGWALIVLSAVRRNTQDLAGSLSASKQAVDILSSAATPAVGPHPLFAAATHDAPWLTEHQTVRTILLSRAWGRVAISERMLRNYPGAAHARDAQIGVLATIRDLYPSLYADVLGARSTIARVTGDMATALRMLDLMNQWGHDSQDAATYRVCLGHASEMAMFLDDWDEAYRLRLERLRLRLEDKVAYAGPMEPTHLYQPLDALRGRGQRPAMTSFGNDAYELARLVLSAGTAGSDLDARQRAREWLDLAEDAWRDFALNGRVAVRFRRLEIDALEGGRDPIDIGRAMVQCSLDWRRLPGKQRAAISAAKYGAAGDEQVRVRLEELCADAPPIDLAQLNAGLALWHLRAADVQEVPARTATLQAAVDCAHAAAAGFVLPRADGPAVNLNPEAFIDACSVQAAALRQLREDDPDRAPVHARDELDARVAALPAIAQRFAASGSRGRRQILESRYHQWLADTMTLAVELDDGRSVDEVAEVLRRDLVGTILLGLSQGEESPQRVADLARQLTATLSATVSELEDEAGSTPPDPDGDNAPDSQTRAVAISAQLDQTLDVLSTVLGPVAKALFDPRTIGQHTTTGALDSAYGDRRGALLSLMLLDGDTPTLVRHLVWRDHDHGAVEEHLDAVPGPSWLPGLEVGNNPDRFFARLSGLGPTVLPPPLAQLLAQATVDDPLPLTVIPTGLLAVPFAALAVDGRLLVESAVVATAQSLQAVHSLAELADTPTATSVPWDVAVYDLAKLTHTRTERDALLAHRPGTHVANSLAEMASALASPLLRGALGILALGVHGSRGTDGWTQAKLLPSGELLTTGHVLQWYLPRLVVGASCNTDIRADAGGELGGFPLAFQLRGAVTIIGTLHYVEDESTAAIMAHLYAGVSGGMSTAAALRQAQLDWINQDRSRRLADRERWAYLLCYGLPG